MRKFCSLFFCKSSHTLFFTIIQQMSLEQFFTDIKDEIEKEYVLF